VLANVNTPYTIYKKELLFFKPSRMIQFQHYCFPKRKREMQLCLSLTMDMRAISLKESNSAEFSVII